MPEVIDLEAERDARKLREMQEWAAANLTPQAIEVAAEQYFWDRLEESRVECAAIMSRLQEQG